jgi:hypothetical protein
MTSDPNDPDPAFEYPSIDYPPAYPPAPPPGYLPPGLPPVYQPQYGTGPYDPYQIGRPHGTNGQAIGALVAATIGIPVCFCAVPSIVAIVLGIVAMIETRRTGQDGHGMALAAVIIAGVTLAITVVFYIWAALAPDTTTSQLGG